MMSVTTRLKRGENFDTKIPKLSHIPEVQLYNEIKQFYRMFQTEETEDRLEQTRADHPSY